MTDLDKFNLRPVERASLEEFDKSTKFSLEGILWNFVPEKDRTIFLKEFSYLLISYKLYVLREYERRYRGKGDE